MFGFSSSNNTLLLIPRFCLNLFLFPDRLHLRNGQIMEKADTGVIHGRFQVLHNDHIKYLLKGKEQCRNLVIGITNPDPVLTRQEKSDKKRSGKLSNPLTYYERYQLIDAALNELGISREKFQLCPFQ